MHARRPWLGSLALVVAFAAVAIVWHAPIERAMLAGLIDVVTGDRVAFGSVSIADGVASLDDVRVWAGDTTLLRAHRVRVRFSLAAALGRGPHRYGLLGVELDAPVVELARSADGTFAGLPRPRTSGTPGGASPRGGAPLAFALTVRDGRVRIDDPQRVLASARHLAIDDVNVTARIDDAGRTAYRVTASLARPGGGAPFVVTGAVDVRRGYAVHRLRAPRLPVPVIANYFINAYSARVLAGDARDVDLRAYAFLDAAGATRYHIAGGARLDGGAMHVPGLLPAATAMSGRIDFDDVGLVSPRLEARLGPLRVRLAGGVVGWSGPQLRLGVAARGDLAAFRSLFRFARAQPMRGAARFSTLVEGAASSPLVATRVAAPAAVYGRFPISDFGGRALYYASAVDVVAARGRYGGLGVRVDGSIALGPTVRTRLVATAHGAARRIPYLAQVAPSAPVAATALLSGAAITFGARGVATVGTGADASRAGLFSIDPRGEGRFGPIELVRADGSSVAGAYFSHRVASESAFWLDARDYAFANLGDGPHLPGLALAAPPFAGRLTGAVAGDGTPATFRVAGRVAGRDVRVGNVTLAAVSGRLAGSFANLRLDDVAARGPWGTFAGRGAYDERRLALVGSYAGTFARLATFGGGFGARGPVVGPVMALIDPHVTVVQTTGASTTGARVAGLPVAGFAGTLGIATGGLHVYAARANVAGATLAAAGVLGHGRSLDLSIANADPRGAFAIAGVAPGRVSALGSVRMVGRRAEFDGGVAVANARVRGLDAGGNGDVAYTGDGLRLRDAAGRLGSALGRVDGTLAGLGTRAFRYDVALHVPEAPLAPLATLVLPNRPPPVGTLSATLRLSGAYGIDNASGRIAVAEGSLNGLGFSDLASDVRVRGAALEARGGRITLGSTRATFAASLDGDDASLRLDAPHADLADVDDYFDAGDALGGRGRIAARFVRSHGMVDTRADLAIASLHYRRFDLGDATARWTSSGGIVRGELSFGGESGRLDASGGVTLPAHAPLALLATRARLEGDARVRGLDLGVWLPALGIALPIGGRLDADAKVTGPLRDPTLATTASLARGSLGAFPVDRLDVRARSTLRRTVVERGDVALPSLALTVTGYLGPGERDPLALAVHAKSTDLAAVARRLSLAELGLAGGGEADLKVRGTRGDPTVAGGFDFEGAAVRGVAVPSAFGQFQVRGRNVVLTGVEVNLAKGTLALAGSLPFQIAPLGFGPPRAPLALDATARGVDLADFAMLLPPGSTLGGTLEARLALGGTASVPRIDGSATLAHGTLRTPAETVPLTEIGGELRFAGRHVTLAALHAAAGGGVLDAHGDLDIADRDARLRGARYTFAATARALRLNLPAYGAGQLDAALTLARAAGRPKLTGNVAVSDATIPFSALAGGGGADGGAPGVAFVPPDLTFDFDVDATRNDRVRSANVDIGTRGSVHVGGDLAAPRLAGAFSSTGGTIAYFSTAFRLVDGTVTFEPDLGVVPTLDVRAVTHVTNPDPNAVRNASGSADVTLALTGPVTNLSIGLTSDPAYEKAQILGLLLNAPAFGASGLFGETSQNPTLYGSNGPATTRVSTVATTRNASGELSVAQEAFGIANAQFTRALLAPIESTFADALGLSNFNVNVDYTGNVGLSARKILGKRVNALYGTSFGYPYRQTFGFEIKPSESEAAQVTVFQTLGATGLNSLTPTTLTSTGRVQSAQPSSGSVGFSLSFQRLFP